ncbi:hypothetical protein AB0M43_14510 [Longispora sp. NPDC051575]|uniref:hypothetical protein n=1 Tax=Longispora sp. NPDC051575 TaxID=3154943 RepID=UPI003445F327
MTLHNTLLARLCRDAGYELDLEQRAVATACDAKQVMAFLDAAYALAAAQQRAEWAREAVAATHDLIRGMGIGEITSEATMLYEATTALGAAEKLAEDRTATFTKACDTLYRYSDAILISEPANPASTGAVAR